MLLLLLLIQLRIGVLVICTEVHLALRIKANVLLSVSQFVWHNTPTRRHVIYEDVAPCCLCLFYDAVRPLVYTASVVGQLVNRELERIGKKAIVL